MDEKALVESAREGSACAFNQLVLLYQSMAYNVAYRILNNPDAAADATQDAFLSAPSATSDRISRSRHDRHTSS
ncbi:MAG: hypothetical protein JXA93_06430 [Anaerolineae bacterium]|nr:hypothetical protein [Anaerolineae bacterium]